MDKELWIEAPDDILNAPESKRRQAAHIGCPLDWFALIYPVARSKAELAVALHLYRLRIIQRRRVVKVSNVRLLAELGINRFAKYRALKRFADAGIITVKRNRHRSLEIVFHRRTSARYGARSKQVKWS